VQPFIYPDETSYFELRKTVSELCFGKTTAKEYNGLDFGGKDCLAVFPFEAVLQMIYHDIEAVFQRTVDLEKELFVRVWMIKYKLFTNCLLELLKGSELNKDRVQYTSTICISKPFEEIPVDDSSFLPFF
jgi:hypothetical protein